ncbi:hypothetical protein HID58_031500 [Brassica napus]|uniref:Uncharacterized protein n=1 Tax=Brassica napus TaxID=3708 RepID=A0ABQ8BTQ4_BRANA|nr:hypothetical protein HID58_031500 [Brassica napus]
MVGCLVQLLRGVWSQTEYDEWRFQIDPGNLEYRAMVGGSESIESLETTIRQGFTLPPETPITLTYRLPSCMVVPDRNRTPPVTIVSRNDIDIMMGLRQSFSELALCVTTGSEAVARYKLMTSNTPLNNTASFVDEVPNVRAGVGNNGDDGTIYHSKCNNFSTTEETSSTVGWRNNRGPVDNDDLINLVDFSSDGDSDLGISPSIDSQNIDDINAEVPEFTLFPPACRRPPGRPRKKRFFSRGEFCYCTRI